MKISHSVSIDLVETDVAPVVRMKQGDEGSREIAVSLTQAGAAWTIPEEVTVVQLAYCKADRVGGCYDRLEDGTNAWEIPEGRGTVIMQIHPQVLTVAGSVFCELRLRTDSGACLNSFTFIIEVQKSPIDMALASEGYYNCRFNVFGDPAALTTSDKTSIVAAINSLVDLIPVSDDTQAALMRAFAGEAIELEQWDTIGVPIINSRDGVDGNVSRAVFRRSQAEEDAAGGDVEIPTTARVQELIEDAIGAIADYDEEAV